MIFSYPFDSVHTALVWYFNRDWERAANYARTSWPDGDRVQSSTKLTDTEKVVYAFLVIRKILSEVLTLRDFSILGAYYRHRGATQAEVAMQFHLKSDRAVRYIKDRVIDKVEDSFIKGGVVNPPKKEPPIYAE